MERYNFATLRQQLGVAVEDFLRIYPPGVTFTLQMLNATQNPADMHLRLYWWEVSPEFLPDIIEV